MGTLSDVGRPLGFGWVSDGFDAMSSASGQWEPQQRIFLEDNRNVRFHSDSVERAACGVKRQLMLAFKIF